MANHLAGLCCAEPTIDRIGLREILALCIFVLFFIQNFYTHNNLEKTTKKLYGISTVHTHKQKTDTHSDPE